MCIAEDLRPSHIILKIVILYLSMILFVVFILFSAILGLLWAYYHYEQLKKIPIGGSFAID